MDPIMIGGAVMAAGAIAQWFNSEAARRANKEQLQAMYELWSKLQSPNFDVSQITPEDYQLAANYIPETAAFIEEAAPQTVERTKEYDLGRDAQLQALYRYMDLADTGKDPRLQINMEKAWNKSNQEANAQIEGIRQKAEEQGTLGSGVSTMLQATASQNAADRAADMSAAEAEKAYEARLSALASGARLGGDIGEAEYQRAAKNADIINSFNQRMAARGQQVESENADIRNAGQRFNIQSRQDVMNRNTGAANDAAWRNRDMKNKYLQQGFDNQADILRGQMGLGREQRADTMGNAQDQNQAIQGLANAGMNWAGYEQSRGDQRRAEQRHDDRIYFDKYGRWMNEGERKARRTPYEY